MERQTSHRNSAARTAGQTEILAAAEMFYDLSPVSSLERGVGEYVGRWENSVK